MKEEGTWAGVPRWSEDREGLKLAQRSLGAQRRGGRWRSGAAPEGWAPEEEEDAGAGVRGAEEGRAAGEESLPLPLPWPLARASAARSRRMREASAGEPS